MLKDISFEPSYKVDFVFDGANFDGKIILDICSLREFYGQEISEPYIAIKNLTLSKDNVTLLSPDKSPTIKITLPNGVSIMKFKSNKEEYEQLAPEVGCVKIDLVGKCSLNEWNGNITPQILTEDYDIVGIQKYYF